MNMNVVTNFVAFAERAHWDSVRAGWYSDPKTGEPIPRDRGEMFCLMHSEVSEAMEGVRKNLMDDKLPHRKMVEVELADVLIRIADYADYVQNSVQILDSAMLMRDHEVTNLGDALTGVHAALSLAYLNQGNGATPMGAAVRLIVNIADHLKLDLEAAIREKMEFNKTRKDHTLEARRAANGKAF